MCLRNMNVVVAYFMGQKMLEGVHMDVGTVHLHKDSKQSYVM